MPPRILSVSFLISDVTSQPERALIGFSNICSHNFLKRMLVDARRDVILSPFEEILKILIKEIRRIYVS